VSAHDMSATRNDGFTLIELLLVVGLIAVLAATTAPSIAGGMRRFTLTSASQQVASTIRTARYQAVGKNMTVRVRFDYPADAGLAYTVPEGHVAVSLAVDDVSGVSGLVKPGDSVIVFASYEPSGRESAVTKAAIGRARVLAVGETISAETAQADQEQDGGVLGQDATQAEKETYRTVTLALSVDDAQ